PLPLHDALPIYPSTETQDQRPLAARLVDGDFADRDRGKTSRRRDGEQGGNRKGIRVDPVAAYTHDPGEDDTGEEIERFGRDPDRHAAERPAGARRWFYTGVDQILDGGTLLSVE